MAVGLTGRALKVFHGLCVVAVFQFDAQPTTTHENGLIGHRTDTRKRIKHDVAGIRPQVDAALDYIQLQRADVLFVLFIAGALALQGVRLSYIHPDRRGVFLPHIHGKGLMVVRDRLRVFTRLAECHHVIRQPLPRHRRILADLLV